MLYFYTVKMKYVRNLMNIDHQNIMSISSQHKKNKRAYVGIIVMVNNHKYCIPLSSVEEKPKYREMSDNITFRKITNAAGKVIGVLNINNMIPVREECLQKNYIEWSVMNYLLKNERFVLITDCWKKNVTKPNRYDATGFAISV